MLFAVPHGIVSEKVLIYMVLAVGVNLAKCNIVIINIQDVDIYIFFYQMLG